MGKLVELDKSSYQINWIDSLNLHVSWPPLSFLFSFFTQHNFLIFSILDSVRFWLSVQNGTKDHVKICLFSANRSSIAWWFRQLRSDWDFQTLHKLKVNNFYFIFVWISSRFANFRLLSHLNKRQSECKINLEFKRRGVWKRDTREDFLPEAINFQSNNCIRELRNFFS